ncbi:hypothetical protein [Bacteroides caecimuris]|jgi:hypothetical protein|uniref:hypothetical protein n=1 Tax=Bacteroides caecimuris TaxID=1796613 RepID=UPI0026E9F9A4|nr:hypothetical protein [Bacteroides caecimuris]
MKLTDKRFWIFEAMALLSSFLTVGLLWFFESGPMGLDDFFTLYFITCLPNYLIGQAVAWKVFKRGSWLKLGLLIYVCCIIFFAIILVVVSVIDYLLYSEQRAEIVQSGMAPGFTAAGISVFILLYWSVLSFVPSMMLGALSAVFRLISQKEVDKRDAGNNFCPVCGYPLGNYNPWGDDGKTPTFDICPCCGVEWGNEDYTTESRTEYRNKWLADGAKWFEPQKKPVNWNLEEQLKDIDHETDG